jgi:hypothetical protein
VDDTKKGRESDTTRYADHRSAVDDVRKRTGKWAIHVKFNVISWWFCSQEIFQLFYIHLFLKNVKIQCLESKVFKNI